VVLSKGTVTALPLPVVWAYHISWQFSFIVFTNESDQYQQLIYHLYSQKC